MRSLLRALALVVATAGLVVAAEPPIPTPKGYVTDLAGVLPADVTSRLTALLTELKAKTGAEIAVLTVRTTAPLDDFTYGMRVVDAWRPGRKREDTGLLVLVAVDDRKLRVLTGYGLEGILPDGLVGQIQDEKMVPAFRDGRLAAGIESGVRDFASRIAADKGVTLTGVPPPMARSADREVELPFWVIVLIVIVLFGMLGFMALAGASMPRGRRRYGGGWNPGWGGGGFGRGGGFGGGGGGFGGFGGGGFGGGGAGRSW
jgi:uncharacterized protein